MVQSGNETRPRAGGGFPVAPKAYLNDGILDLMVVVDFQMRELGVVLGELENIDDPRESLHALSAEPRVRDPGATTASDQPRR
jgi:hypothetical protein